MPCSVGSKPTYPNERLEMTSDPTSNLELGLIGNCQVAVLIDRVGRFVWGSFPRMDSDPAFCSLLNPVGDGDSPGCFDIELANLASSEQAYVENTAILTTTLRDQNGGAVKIIDFAPRFAQFGRQERKILVPPGRKNHEIGWNDCAVGELDCVWLNWIWGVLSARKR